MEVKLYDSPENIDQKIVYLARVSSDNPDNPKYEGLLKYLIREGHWSPFDMVNVTFEINTEKDVGIQLLRHQGLKPQEWSQRYADCSGMKSEPRECRLQDESDRQNSLVCLDVELIDWWYKKQIEIQEISFSAYEEALKKGIAKELARGLLPIGLTSTKMYFNGSIRSWLFYCLSRTHKSTQKEHRLVAKKILSKLFEIAPCTTKAFVDKFMSGEDFDIELDK
ncbi:FAD-dependent thymidylate synthase [Acinetobacter phage Mithridates]|nr:FAD-dependent thymidylate synthase [Acinetobacter phage Mithridates]